MHALDDMDCQSGGTGSNFNANLVVFFAMLVLHAYVGAYLLIMISPSPTAQRVNENLLPTKKHRGTDDDIKVLIKQIKVICEYIAYPP
jgi:hypothetical protein